ncbi:carbohydrate-binding family 9-like protein [Saccharicrinis aurantiacus]|uniref:carbohydrate-binding family 9-like protein n=1 Tax=Saccharicrinis aurantiacus TaxID=1849719 RepID=UPI0024933C8E|nr:carbohydrate-binding family 9-like protein [Saccharicrinis aurantiacus]
MNRRVYISLITILCSIALSAQDFRFIEPERYLCKKITGDIVINGDINKPEWQDAQWTNLFVDIEGHDIHKPYFETMAKMLWNDDFLYFAFYIEEEHIWATIKDRDEVIFHDNDIEIFIDANGDTHNYIELELNALNTAWDLYLAKPYREAGPVINEYDIKGLQSAIKINGTLNNPNDKDDSWTVEVAIPWESIISTNTPKRLPVHGENMRINFSRVQWESEVINGTYHKKKHPNTGRFLPENNWVWSPIGAIDMHRPELWGMVTFLEYETTEGDNFYDYETEFLRQFIAHIYKAQKQYFNLNKHYAKSLEALNIDIELSQKYQITLNTLSHSFEITGTTPDSKTSFLSNTEGRLRKIN